MIRRVVTALFLAMLPAGLMAAGVPLRVGKIVVQTAPLFGDAESGSGFYRTANLLHVQTQERLIRRFLLFHEGDPFDATLLQETERNLRTLDFLESVSVTAGRPHDGVVDVTVRTQDAWTTDVNADFSNDGGQSLYEVDAAQKNLFGSGAEVDLRVATLRERRTRSVELLHPAVFGPYWSGDLLLADSSDGNEQRLAIDRPLVSYETAFTFNAVFDHLLQIGRTYAAGTVASSFRQQHHQLSVTAGRIISSRPSRAASVIAGADLITDEFIPRQGTPPAQRRFRFVEGGFDSQGFDFLKLDHVDLGMREQDFNLGLRWSLLAGVSPAAFRTGRTVFRLRSENSAGHAFSPRAFVLATLSASTRARARNRNTIVSADSRFVMRLPSRRPQTFVSRLRLDFGDDLDRDVQFFADGQNGLRAYPNFSFAGNRRVLFNAEHRLFLGRELLDLFEPGAALFVDSGTVVEDRMFRFRDLHTDAGAGLRVAIPKFESALIRLDFAYAFNDSPLRRRGFVVSLATTQAF